MAVIGGFQEKQQHLLLISQHNSLSNLLCTGAICMNTTKNVVPLHNDSTYAKLPPHLVMLPFVLCCVVLCWLVFNCVQRFLCIGNKMVPLYFAIAADVNICLTFLPLENDLTQQKECK